MARPSLEDLLAAGGSSPALRAMVRDSQPLGDGYYPELPAPLVRRNPMGGADLGYLDLESRMPELDHVPDTVTHPEARRRAKALIHARQQAQVEARRQSNQWGGSVQNLKSGGAGTVLRWMNVDDQPVPVTLQLGYTLDDVVVESVMLVGADGTMTGQVTNQSTVYVPKDTDNLSIYARIDWGGGGVANSAFCDLQQGTQIRITATFVNVSVVYNRPLPPNYPDVLEYAGVKAITGPPVTVSGMVGRGHPQLNVSGARFTVRLATLAAKTTPADPDSTRAIRIPPYASAYGLSFATSAGVNVRVRTYAAETLATDSIASEFIVTDSTPATDFRHLIAQGQRFLELSNLDTGAGIDATVVFSLMMG